NTATAQELQKLSGIGQKRAEQIIECRERIGGFKSIDDLKQVSGIGVKTIEKLKPHLIL
ncbi:MAG: helix-hairpin-helix domain-containing protein, partial [Lactobacillus iners]|nr:helix-hairpin-helix domain-containing protein [Lactobacillus iners]